MSLLRIGYRQAGGAKLVHRILPVQDEQTELRRKAYAIIQNWGITPVDYPKVRLRLTIIGYSENKNNALTILKDCFAPFQFYKNEDIDSAGLNIARDSDRSMLAEIVNQSIAEQTFLSGEDEPTRDDILLSALQIIYGSKNVSSN